MLRLVRRILEYQRENAADCHENGKPSALTRPDGRIYRNAFDFDPHIIAKTFAKVSRCRKVGTRISAFTLARDYELVSFVRLVSSIFHRNAYFMAPYTLGTYGLIDRVDK